MVLGIFTAAIYLLEKRTALFRRLQKLHTPAGYLLVAVSGVRLALTVRLIRQRPVPVTALGMEMVALIAASHVAAWPRKCRLHRGPSNRATSRMRTPRGADGRYLGMRRRLHPRGGSGHRFGRENLGHRAFRAQKRARRAGRSVGRCDSRRPAGGRGRGIRRDIFQQVIDRQKKPSKRA
jgi:hypothetical protein